MFLQPPRRLLMEEKMNNTISYWFEGEITNFIKVWISVCISLSYCYFATRISQKAPARLFLLLPVVALFFLLPLSLHSIHLGTTTAFFIAWLSNFKLLMLAFSCGPLSDPSVSSLPRFLAVASLPIKITISKNEKSPSDQKSAISYAIKGLILGTLIKLHDYKDHINPYIMSIMQCFHIYLALEFILAVAASMARGMLGVELDPTFDEPFLSSSLQDFWGRRWNIMVNRILRPSVYDPLLKFSSGFLGRKWAPLPAVFGTFVVSGLMHEIVFYYMGRRKPTWRTTWFFLIHGTCLVAEVAVKKVVKGRWRLPRFVGTIFVFGFVMSTGLWLFLPDMLRLDAEARAFREYAAVGGFVKHVTRAFIMNPSVDNATVF